MKNTPKILLTAFMLVGIIVSPVNAAFPDVSSDHIYSDAINYVREEGTVSGFSDGTYRPENSITRAEFTKIIINSKFDWVGDRSLSFEQVQNFYEENNLQHCILAREGIAFYSDFHDVQPLFSDRIYLGEDEQYGNEFSKYTCVAKGKNILLGYLDGTFRPDNPITVGEASKILSNAYGFTDVDSGPEGDIFEPFVSALARKNAIPTGIVSIDSELKRGEMAEIIYRLEKEVTDKESKKYEDLVWVEYIHEEYGYSVEYPSSWSIEYYENFEEHPIPPCAELRLTSNSGYNVYLNWIPSTINLYTGCRTSVGANQLKEDSEQAEFLSEKINLDSYIYSYGDLTDIVFIDNLNINNGKFSFEFYKEDNSSQNGEDIIKQDEYLVALEILERFNFTK